MIGPAGGAGHARAHPILTRSQSVLPYSARWAAQISESAAPAMADDAADLIGGNASTSDARAMTCAIMRLSDVLGMPVDSSSERDDDPDAHERKTRICSPSERSL